MRKKALIGLCVLILAFFIGAYIFIRSSFFTDRLRLTMESTLEKQLGREVSVDKVTGNIFGNIAIAGISVAKNEKLSDGKLLDIRKIKAGYSLINLLRLKFVIRSVKITQPHIWLERDAEGELNIPEFAAAENGGKKSRFSVVVSNADILFGRITFDDRKNSIHSTITGINGRLRRTGREMEYSGEIRARDIEFSLRGISKTISDIAASFETSEWGVISALQMRLGKSHLQASAEILLDDPILMNAEVQSRLFLEDVSEFLAAPNASPPKLDGIAEIYGVISGKLPDIGCACVVSVPVMKVNDLEIRNVDAEAKFTQNAVSLTYLSADLTEGGARISGGIRLDSGKISGCNALLKMDHLDVGRIMAELSGSEPQLLGRLSGELTIQGDEPRPGNIDLDGEFSMLDARWKNATSTVPIGTVEVSLSVKGKSLALSMVRGKTRAELTGELSDAAELDLRAKVDIPDAGELTSLLAGSPPISGSGSVDARASMEITVPEFRASMGLPPADSHSGLIQGIARLRGRVDVNMPDLRLPAHDDHEEVQLGSLTGIIHLDDDQLDIDKILLQLGDSKCLAAAKIHLKKDSKHEIAATLTIDSLPMANYTPLIESPLQLSGGLVNGKLEVHGEPADMNGGGDISVTGLSVGGRDIERVSLPIEIESNVLSIPALVVSSLGEQITASCRLAPSGDYDLKVDSSLIALSRFSPSNSAISGTIQLSLSGRGNTRSPSLRGKLNLRDFRYEGEDFGDGELVFNLRDEKAHADISLSDRSLIATLDAGTQHPFPVRAIVQLGNINLEPVLNMADMGGKIDLHIAGSIDVSGEAANPVDLSVDAKFQTVILDVQRRRWRNDGIIKLAFDDRKLRVDSLKMKGAGGRFLVTGGFDMAGAIGFSATAENLNLAVVSELLELPNPVAGRLNCRLKMGGKVSTPSLEIKLDASKMTCEGVNVDGLSATASYRNGMMEIERSRLRAFGGEIRFRAMMPVELDFNSPPTPDQLITNPIYAFLDAENIDLNFISSVAPDVSKSSGEVDDVHFKMTGSLKLPVIRGSLKLKNARFQTETLPVFVEDANGSLSLASRKQKDGATSPMEYKASAKLGWKMEKGRYDAQLLVTDAGQALSVWHQILGIEPATPTDSQPSFQLDLRVRNGRLTSLVKQTPETIALPVDGSFSGEAHFNGELGAWINEPVDLLSALSLPLRGNVVINSLDLAVDDHKIKNRGRIRASLADGKLEIPRFQLLTLPPQANESSARVGLATISGGIGADETFRLSFAGEHIHPGLFSSLLDSPGFDTGELTFSADASGNLNSPVVAFSLTAKDVQIPAPSTNGDTKIDAFLCEISYKDEILNIEKLHFDSFDNQLDVNGKLPVKLSLMPIAVEPLDREMDVQLTMHDFDLSFLSYFTDKAKSIRGTAEADVGMSGSPKTPILTGSFQLTNAGCQLMLDRFSPAQAESPGKPQPLDIEDVNVSVSIEDGNAVTGSILLQVGEGRYEAHGKAGIDQKLQPQQFDVTFGASPARIAPFIKLAGLDQASPISGEITIDGKLKGDARDFRGKPVLDILRTISGEIQIPASGLKVDAEGHRIINPKRIYAEFQNGMLNLHSLKLIDETAKDNQSSSISALGSWEIDGEKSFNATLNLDMNLVSKLMNQGDLMSGWLSFKLEARGKEVQLFWPPPGASSRQSFTIGHANIDRFDGKLLYKNQEIHVERVRISSDKNRVIFTGNIPMVGKNMDLRLDARLDDMSILSFINRDITESSGRGVIGVAITGDMRKVMAREEPVQFAGFCRFNDLNVHFYEASMDFRDLKAEMGFSFGRANRDRGFLTIKDFRGKMNNGEFVLKTGRSRKPGAEIIWAKKTGYKIGKLRDISIDMMNCALSQPLVFSMLFDGKLSLKGSFDAPIVAGDVTINTGKYTESLDGFVQQLFSSREVGFKAFLDYPLVQDLELDVNVQIPSKMFMKNSLVDVETKAFAKVSGSLAKPIIAAQGHIIAGRFSYFGREFTITKGEITNKSEINPEYSIEAETEITNTKDIGTDIATSSTMKVQMTLNGSLSRPLPPDFVVSGGGVTQEQQSLSRTDIISILTLGATPAAFLDKGLSGSSPLLMQSAKWYLERRAEEMLGLKEFQIQIDPNASRETRLVIAKGIMEQISVLMDFGYGGQQWIGLQRDMGKHIAFDGKVNQYGDWSLDVKIKRDFP